MWSFSTDPAYQSKLDWARDFIKREVEPVDALLGSPADLASPLRQALIPPLQRKVKDAGLWACHLSEAHGGMGFGQLKLGLLNEVIGTSRCAPFVFGCQAPDSGNSELLAMFGSEEQKRRYFLPLVAGEMISCFSMTEPHGGADPTAIRTRAELREGTWVLNGEKWFASNARFADFLIVVAVTDPDAEPHRRASMFLVPRGTPGFQIVRNAASVGQPTGNGSHGYLRFTDVTLTEEQMLGERGNAFEMAQARLGGGRIHHAMRTVGAAQRALDMMCERARSRSTRGSSLASLQLVQAAIADSWLDLEQFRLLVLQTAWMIDEAGDYKAVKGRIAAVKAQMPKVLHDVASRALQIHGSIGVSDEMPFARLIIEASQMGLADGPTEVHKLTLAREVLKGYGKGREDFPAYHIPTVRARAQQQLADVLGGIPEEQTWY